MPLRRLATLLLAVTTACVSGSDETGSRYEGCASDLDCKDGRTCRDGACSYLEGAGGGTPDPDIARVLFRLSLEAGDDAVYVQDASVDRGDAWLDLLRGETGENSQPIAPTCQVCFCGSCQSCGGLCGPGLPVVKRLGGGEAVDVRWDGTTFPIDSTCSGGGPCYSIRPAIEGHLYRARFCWALQATGVGEGQQLVEPIYCQDVPFTYTGSRAQLVQYTITEGA